MASTTSNSGGSIRIVYNKFPEIAKRLPQEASELVEYTLITITAVAHTITPRDTSALANSIGIDFVPGDTYGRVTWSAEYAAFVNFGTIHMRPRSPGPSDKGFATVSAERVMARTNIALNELAKRLENM